MQMKLMVFAEAYQKWPAKNGKPAGESHGLLCLDMSVPPGDALRGMYEYRLSDEEIPKYWGKLERGTIVVGVTQIAVGKSGQPYMRGRMVSAVNAEGKAV